MGERIPNCHANCIRNQHEFNDLHDDATSLNNILAELAPCPPTIAFFATFMKLTTLNQNQPMQSTVSKPNIASTRFLS